MNFVKITATDFLTFRELDYDFQTGQSVLVKGENLTDAGQESNGSGKSAFAAIIEYCLLHTTSRKTLDKDLVTRGQRSSYLSMLINCPDRREQLLIERMIDTKNGGSSQLSLNGEILYSFEDRQVSEIDKYIERWVGINASDIQNYFLISKFKYTSFYSSSNTSLNQLIGRFSNAAIIDGIDKDIEAEAAKLNNKRAVMNDSKNKTLGSIEAYNTQLKSALLVTKEELYQAELRNIDALIADKDRSITANLEKIQLKITEAQQVNHEITLSKETILNTNKELQATKIKDFDEVYKTFDTQINEFKLAAEAKNQAYKDNTTQKHELLLMLQQIELNLKGKVVCPKCNHEFVVGREDVDIATEKEVAEETRALITEFDEQINAIKSSMAVIEDDIKERVNSRKLIENEEKILRETKRRIELKVYELERSTTNLVNKVNIINDDITLIRTQISRIEGEIKALELSKKKLDVNSFDNKEQVESIKTIIARHEQDIVDIDNNMQSVLDEVTELRKWIVIFKEFRQHLSIKVLKILQGHTNKFLEDLKTDLRVKIEGYKVKGDGEKSDKITVSIMRDGDIYDFNTFSGGERARLEAAVILAVQKAINSTHKFGGLDFLFIDEVLESADSLGVTQLMKAFNELPKTILLTTHVPVNSFEFPVLLVRKENKYSKIIQQ